MRLDLRARDLFGIVLASTLLGIVGYAAIGPSAPHLDAGIESGALLLATVGVAVLAGAGGAVAASRISADSAERIESAKQAGARQSRLADQALKLSVEFIEALDAPFLELHAQVVRRQEVAAGGGDPKTIPELKAPLERVRILAGALYLVAEQQTADLADQTQLSLSGAQATYHYDHDLHLKGRIVTPLTQDEYLEFQRRMTQVTQLKTMFMDRIRHELGLPPLEE